MPKRLAGKVALVTGASTGNTAAFLAGNPDRRSLLCPTASEILPFGRASLVGELLLSCHLLSFGTLFKRVTLAT